MRTDSTGPRRPVALALAVLALAASFAGASVAASIEAEIDRNEATLEDRLTLTLTVIGTGVEPQLPALEAFDVVPAGQSKQWNFINGQASTSVSYRYLLLPLEVGEFVIGPATVEIDGKRLASQPFSVRIRAAGAASGQESNLFLTTQLSTTTPYVGEQVLFTWRLYRRANIGNARLDPFEFNGFLVEDLGEVREFETRVNGRTFMVSEIRKALFPQEEGELTIPATRLSCQVAQQGRRRSNSVFSDIFGRVPTETRVLRSDPLQVKVRPLPAAPPEYSGLVGRFELSSKVSQRKTQVGDSVTLTLKVSGTGNVQMIPEPPMAELAAVKVYDDKPGSSIQRQPSGLSGSRTFRKALVPQAAGTLTLPSVRLVYFDPKAEAYRTAATAEIPLQVSPSVNGDEELRLTESLAPSTGKVAVRILAEDILPVYAGIDGIGGPNRPTPVQLATMLLLPLLLYLAALAAARRRHRYRQDSGLERRRRALARARRQLQSIDPANSVNTSEEISRCVREFLGDKLGIEGSALTATEARHHLASRGLEPKRVNEVAGLLDRLEAAHYGPAGDSADLPEEVSEILRGLDREL